MILGVFGNEILLNRGIEKKIKKSVDISVTALYNTNCVTEMDIKIEHRGVAQLG